MKKEAKKVFSRIGLSLLAVLVAGSIVQIAAARIIAGTPRGSKWLTESSLGMMVVSFVPLYVVAFPLGILLMKKMPDCPGEKKSLTIKEWVTYAIMCVPIMYLGNILGTVLSMFLSSGQAENAVMSLLKGNLVVEILFVVILGPFFEELIFRKVIIDKTVCYGEKIAVLFSALTFGLFHGNLFQFFYSFGVGFVFAYVYVKTRRLGYVFGLHALFNFMGGIIPTLLLGLLDKIDMEALETMDTQTLMQSQEVWGSISIFLVYFVFLMVLNVTGIILFIRKRKSFVFEKAVPINKREGFPEEEDLSSDRFLPEKWEGLGDDCPLPEKEEEIGMQTVLLNVGMILFILMILVSFFLALL